MARREEQERLRKPDGPDDDADVGEKSGTDDRPDPKFLPVDLDGLPSAEVQDLFNNSVIYNDSKYDFCEFTTFVFTHGLNSPPLYANSVADDIVAVNKPYGLSMFGHGRHSVETLLPGLAEHLGISQHSDLRPVHRLDRVTTGVLLMAKTPDMHKHLTNLFRQRKVAKQYWAILNGTPVPDQVGTCIQYHPHKII